MANGYKLEDVATAMRKLWGGDSLALKDQERKRGKSLGKIMVNEPYEEPTVWNNTEENDSYSPRLMKLALRKARPFLKLLVRLSEDPECFANFQEVRKLRYSEARKALDKARTSRGFYPSAKHSVASELPLVVRPRSSDQFQERQSPVSETFVRSYPVRAVP